MVLAGEMEGGGNGDKGGPVGGLVGCDVGWLAL